jgi:DNA mismatch repair protein MutL
MAIEILPSEVVNQIAAGEVVERPAHMVKELVENSLDAGATEIAVEFGAGGRFVKVTDNGAGISAEDLPKAFLRFATSKIKASEDLWQLSSFGFRGEALASIASVSRVTIFSSQDNSGQGYRLSSEFGVLSSLESASRSRGSTIIVEDLFKNVPARLKFMKGDAAEAGQIKQVLKALAMANPVVSFRVVQDGKLLFYWPATSIHQERIESVLDVRPLYEGTAVRGRVRARCFFSDPHQVSRVSRSLWFFAQNRSVQDRSLQAAVMEAYRNLLMTGEYPHAVCFLETDPAEIDVNIHPSKSQVKFVNPQEAFRAVQSAIRNVLEQAPWLQQNPETSIGVAYHDAAEKAPVAPTPVNLEFEDAAIKTTQFRTKTDHRPFTIGTNGGFLNTFGACGGLFVGSEVWASP